MGSSRNKLFCGWSEGRLGNELYFQDQSVPGVQFPEGLKGTTGIQVNGKGGAIVSARNMAQSSVVKIEAISGRETNV